MATEEELDLNKVLIVESPSEEMFEKFSEVIKDFMDTAAIPFNEPPCFVSSSTYSSTDDQLANVENRLLNDNLISMIAEK